MLFILFIFTIVAALGIVYIVTLLWTAVFATAVPSFISGLAGGLAALPIWEGLKKIQHKNH